MRKLHLKSLHHEITSHGLMICFPHVKTYIFPEAHGNKTTA